MKLTKKQKAAVLPYLQQAVQAQLDRWDAEKGIENALGIGLDLMQDGIQDLAISCDYGRDVKLEHVQDYVDTCIVLK